MRRGFSSRCESVGAPPPPPESTGRMDAALAAGDGQAAVTAALEAEDDFALLGLPAEPVAAGAVKRRYYKLALLIQ